MLDTRHVAQYSIMFGTFMMTFVYLSCLLVVRVLVNPVSSFHEDSFDPDGFIGSVEQATFATLRCCFDRQSRV